MSQPARPGGRAPSARDRPAPAPPAHPQHRPPARRQIRWPRQPDGRTVLEVTDPAGNLTGLAASTRLPVTSAGGAWRGTRRTADGTRQRRALAIGHAYPPDGPLTVTFTRRARRTTIHPATVDGLWAAAVTGHYTAARCHTPAAASARQLTPVTPPATATLNPGPDTRAQPRTQQLRWPAATLTRQPETEGACPNPAW
jgi:hypothetical protein